MSKVDFSRARVMHRNWRSKLKEFFNGKGTLTKEQAMYHEDCDLGRWLYSEGLSTYGSMPEMRRLEKIHTKLHGRVRNYMEMKSAANAFGIDREWQKIEEMSEEILALLNELEQKEK